MPAIVVEGLTHRYQRAERPAIDRVSFSVDPGEIVGLLGPNGAGKTTTLHAILGLLEPTGGIVRVFGRSPLTERLAVLARLNFASADIKYPAHGRGILFKSHELRSPDSLPPGPAPSSSAGFLSLNKFRGAKFMWMFRAARANGRLGRLGQE